MGKVPRELEQFFYNIAIKPTLNLTFIIDVGTLKNPYVSRTTGLFCSAEVRSGLGGQKNKILALCKFIKDDRNKLNFQLLTYEI